MLRAFGLAPAAHGASGWLDELAPFIIVLLLLLAYLWWARRATAAQDQEEASHENEVAHDGQP
ncbi:MAG: hypothetical protein HYY02_13485 [Chloroflexi bacterium]|nr:hypothetical protein [Chloroflexota bacterium]